MAPSTKISLSLLSHSIPPQLFLPVHSCFHFPSSLYQTPILILPRRSHLFPIHRVILESLFESSFFPTFYRALDWTVVCLTLPLYLVYTYEWVHTMFFLGLGSLTQDDFFLVHPFVCNFYDVIFFYTRVIYHCVNVPHFLYPFFSWGTFEIVFRFWLLWEMLLQT